MRVTVSSPLLVTHTKREPMVRPVGSLPTPIGAPVTDGVARSIRSTVPLSRLATHTSCGPTAMPSGLSPTGTRAVTAYSPPCCSRRSTWSVPAPATHSTPLPPATPSGRRPTSIAPPADLPDAASNTRTVPGRVWATSSLPSCTAMPSAPAPMSIVSATCGPSGGRRRGRRGGRGGGALGGLPVGLGRGVGAEHAGDREQEHEQPADDRARERDRERLARRGGARRCGRRAPTGRPPRARLAERRARGGGELAGALVAVARVLGHRPSDDVVERGRTPARPKAAAAGRGRAPT